MIQGDVRRSWWLIRRPPGDGCFPAFNKLLSVNLVFQLLFIARLRPKLSG